MDWNTFEANMEEDEGKIEEFGFLSEDELVDNAIVRYYSEHPDKIGMEVY